MPTAGVNLGNWLVLEKWMSPELFAGTSAEDEYHLWRALSQEAIRERIKTHRDAWVTDRDFHYLAAHGIELIRIPVPYFMFGDHDSHRPPHGAGQPERVRQRRDLRRLQIPHEAGERRARP
jgi:glucan 1,3-beta-glucosidase